MKKVLLTLSVAVLSTALVAQNSVHKIIKGKTLESGTVHYEQVVKLDIKLDGDAAQFAHALPKERKSEKILFFSKESALYENFKKAEADENMGSESGGVMIKMMVPDNKMFTDLKNKKQIEQREFMTRMFLIEHKTGNSKWKLTGNQKEILNYSCQEATREDDGRIIKAWFCPAIPISVGPESYCDLPGLILEVDIDNGQNVITAKSIDTKPADKEMFVKPKKGKKVTDEEFQKIVDEKMKEMGQESGEGGHQIMIKIQN